MTKPLLRLAIVASVLTSATCHDRGTRDRRPWRRPACPPCLLAAPGRSAVAELQRRRMRPPKLTYERIKLPNGLTVLLHQDRSTPIAHVQLWYHVGSKDERAGRTGFAHLFEHMMFKGSKNVEPEQHTSIVSSVGGQANAYTTEDSTVYWQTVPRSTCRSCSGWKRDRMATLRIDERHVPQRARSGQGRAPDAHREPAVRPAQRDSVRSGVHRASLPAIRSSAA